MRRRRVHRARPDERRVGHRPRRRVAGDGSARRPPPRLRRPAAPPPAPRSPSRVVLVHFPEGRDRLRSGAREDPQRLGQLAPRVPRQAARRVGAASTGSCSSSASIRALSTTPASCPSNGSSTESSCVGRHGADELVVTRRHARRTARRRPGPVLRSDLQRGRTRHRVRGVQIKRRAIEAGSAGLAFSHDILEELLARRGPSHRLVRVTQDEIVPDLVAEIRRRARLKGIEVPEPQDEPGVAPGAAPPETTAKDRAAILAVGHRGVAASGRLDRLVLLRQPDDHPVRGRPAGVRGLRRRRFGPAPPAPRDRRLRDLAAPRAGIRGRRLRRANARRDSSSRPSVASAEPTSSTSSAPHRRT